MFGLFNWSRDCELTNYDKIDRYVRKNGSITSIEAAKALNITVLHRAMTEMRRKGYVFQSVWERSESTEKKFKRYFITKRPDAVK